MVQSRPMPRCPSRRPTRPPVARPLPRRALLPRGIVEQMPDPLTPLFADLIDPSVTRSLRGLMGQVFGDELLGEGDIGCRRSTATPTTTTGPARSCG